MLILEKQAAGWVMMQNAFLVPIGNDGVYLSYPDYSGRDFRHHGYSKIYYPDDVDYCCPGEPIPTGQFFFQPFVSSLAFHLHLSQIEELERCMERTILEMEKTSGQNNILAEAGSKIQSSEEIPASPLKQRLLEVLKRKLGQDSQ